MNKQQIVDAVNASLDAGDETDFRLTVDCLTDADLIAYHERVAAFEVRSAGDPNYDVLDDSGEPDTQASLDTLFALEIAFRTVHESPSSGPVSAKFLARITDGDFTPGGRDEIVNGFADADICARDVTFNEDESITVDTAAGRYTMVVGSDDDGYHFVGPNGSVVAFPNT